MDMLYPYPIGSDTFCRELVDVPVGETDTSGGLHPLAELTRVLFLREEDRETRSPRCLAVY